MSLRVTFVNFPASEKVRNLIANRIEDHVERFGEHIEAARVVVSEEKNMRHVRLLLQGGGHNLTVHAEAPRAGRALDSAIDKLCGVLRKHCSRSKHKSHGRDCGSIHAKGTMRCKHGPGAEALNENAFDRFEKEFVREFEENFEKAG